MNTAKQQLVNHGVHPSVQRIAIMKYLMEHRTHPTVDTIYTDLLPILPTLSRTTVYNTLELFCEKNAAMSLTIDRRNIRYDGCVKPHAHFMCNGCGRVFDVEINEGAIKWDTFRSSGAGGQNVRAHLYDSDQYAVEKVELNFSGLCPECLEEKKKLQ